MGGSGYTYTGSHVNGIPDGVGFYEKSGSIIYATLENNEYHGFRIDDEPSKGNQWQEEMRSNERAKETASTHDTMSKYIPPLCYHNYTFSGKHLNATWRRNSQISRRSYDQPYWDKLDD